MIHETISPAQIDGQHQRPPTVYLVDNDMAFLRAWSRRLRAANYRVETFGSAEEFLKRDPSETAGCVVLYLQMAGPSGLELQEALASASFTKSQAHADSVGSGFATLRFSGHSVWLTAWPCADRSRG